MVCHAKHRTVSVPCGKLAQRHLPRIIAPAFWLLHHEASSSAVILNTSVLSVGTPTVSISSLPERVSCIGPIRPRFGTVHGICIGQRTGVQGDNRIDHRASLSKAPICQIMLHKHAL